ncbi:hypothetical protein [Nocardia caishijiensis]|uniref:hypothetical protein n=1 Tax=Nocardia caishijiensis TaxID=184756 RepID=UPI0012ED6002|nr:hypothetical protein [Nocardia caishijiensis]
MSVNVGVFVEISGLRDDREQAGMTTLLTEVVRAERLDDEVFVSMRGVGDDLAVRADSGDHKVIFAGFFRWQEDFEQRVTARATRLVPHARVRFGWEYEDEF